MTRIKGNSERLHVCILSIKEKLIPTHCCVYEEKKKCYTVLRMGGLVAW